MPAFPEGWDDPQQFREKGFQKKKEEVKEMPKKDIDFEAIVARAQEVAAERGISLYKASGIVAQETGLHRTTVYNHARAMLQTPSPEPAAAANQEPEREKVESATQSVAQEEPEITVKDVLQYKLAQKEQHTLPQIWTESDKQLARKLKEDGLSMRQIADAMGFTYRQVKGFFERERAKQRKPNQNDVLSKYKVKWIRDVMLDDLDPGVQLRIVAAVQGLEI